MIGPRFLLSFLVLVPACGVASSNEPVSSVPPAAVARIVCGPAGATVVTPRVRARSDGIHIRFRNVAGAIEFYMRAEGDPTQNHGGRLRARLTEGVASHPPGKMLVACRRPGEAPPPFYGDDPRYDSFEIVDPDELWVPIHPGCSDIDRVRDRRLPRADSVTDVEAWVRDHFDVHGGRRVRPGYPETQWKGNPWVISESGTTLAYFHAFRDDRGWMLPLAEGCPAP